MMNKLQSRIMNASFGKIAKHFILLALVIVIVGGILVGVVCRAQIGEILTYQQNAKIITAKLKPIVMRQAKGKTPTWKTAAGR